VSGGGYHVGNAYWRWVYASGDKTGNVCHVYEQVSANHIGDVEVLREAIALAKRQLGQSGKTDSEKDAK